MEIKFREPLDYLKRLADTEEVALISPLTLEAISSKSILTFTHSLFDRTPSLARFSYCIVSIVP